MPSSVLSNQPIDLEPFDVLGSGDIETGLLTHAMLCRESQTVTIVLGENVQVIDMGPPLADCDEAPTVAGSAGLSEKQRRKIKAFVDGELSASKAKQELSERFGIKQYVIHPSSVAPSAKLPSWRYSCVGFVLRAYRRGASIQLLASPCPLKSVDEIQVLYPNQDLSKKFRRKWLGVGDGTGTERDGVECWPIDLVGYLFHSLERPVEEINGEKAIPYQPQEGDEFFPRQKPETAENGSDQVE
jgi:hypothetical protein